MISRREFLQLSALALFVPFVKPEERIPPNPFSEKIKSLADPDFFTSSDNSLAESILVGQFDPEQYDGSLNHPNIKINKQNSCGQAAIATIINTYATLLRGEEPNFRIADVIKLGYNGQMSDFGMYNALTDLGGETGLFAVAESPALFFDKPQIIPRAWWKNIYRSAKENVFDKGGLLVARGFKYGTRDNPQSHFIGLSSNEHLILDSRGGGENGEQSRVVDIDLAEYFQDEGGNGLLSVQGVIPNIEITSTYYSQPDENRPSKRAIKY